MSLQELFHSVATGPARRRQLLTPVGLGIFGLTLVVVVVGGLVTYRELHLPELLPGTRGTVIGVLVLLPGAHVHSPTVASQ
jgi:hypothetical protein